MQHDRRAEADLGPVPGHRHDLLGAGALAPLRVVDDGRVLLEKSHAGQTRTCSSSPRPNRHKIARLAAQTGEFVSARRETSGALFGRWPEEDDELADATGEAQAQRDAQAPPAVQQVVQAGTGNSR